MAEKLASLRKKGEGKKKPITYYAYARNAVGDLRIYTDYNSFGYTKVKPKNYNNTSSVELEVDGNVTVMSANTEYTIPSFSTYIGFAVRVGTAGGSAEFDVYN